MVDAPAVAEAIKPGEFYGMVSAEKASDLESDVFLTWVDSPDSVETISNDKLLGKIPAIAEGHWYAETDKANAMASTNPTPLSIPVIVSDFLPHVVEAITGA
jgi:iron complex transport system substrate-binding protein